jgi:hypothetical protein
MGNGRENTSKGGEQDPGFEEGERVDWRRDRGDSSRRRLVPPEPGTLEKSGAWAGSGGPGRPYACASAAPPVTALHVYVPRP